MLSILIPIYNFNVTDLVSDLHEQAERCNINFEILCFDDCSDLIYQGQNKAIGDLQYVTYEELEVNYGRSKIRNLLAERSKYDNLLFLDCDSALPSREFVKKYIIHIENYNVVYGGRIYEEFPPLPKAKYFRWLYGKKRESITVDRRINAPYKSFMTNNFLIQKKAFLSIRLNESIIGYGHEDTLFGIRLRENSVIIKHINNPVVHVGLEDFEEYMQKTHEGLKNLVFIGHVVEIRDSVRLYKYLKLVNRYGLSSMVLWWTSMLNKRILANLSGSRPIMVLFDLYKLGVIIRLYREDQLQ